MVLPTFVEQALEGRPLTVYGSGRQSRCFSAVADITRAWVALSDCEGAAGGIYNVGSSDEITIQALAELVREVTGSDSEIVHVPYETAYRPGFEDMARRVPRLDRLRQALGWVPSTAIRDIVEGVVAFSEGRRLVPA